MEPEFITYQKFNDPALAEELTKSLERHHIECLIEEDSVTFDPSFSFNTLAKDYLVKIRPEDFTRANELLTEDADADI